MGRILAVLIAAAGLSACGPSPNYVADMSKHPPPAYTPPAEYRISPTSLPLPYWRCLQNSQEVNRWAVLAGCRHEIEAYVAGLDMPEDRKLILVRDMNRAGIELLASLPRPEAPPKPAPTPPGQTGPAPEEPRGIIMGPLAPVPPGDLRF
jgi:hypothetical protein